jgi:glycosyltransferase involved in cell wall biosynthesis
MEPQKSQVRYALVSPARNEEAFIELTLQSVVAQTHRPVRWIVVSDGSTDGTDEIVKRYTAQHDWIELLRLPERKERHFGGKVHCFNAGFARLADVDYDIVGSLDADLSFAPGYFEFLMQRFAEDPRLGLAGTPFEEDGKTYDYRYTSKEHVSGACQLFRKKCFADIGGYVPLKGGGIDSVAVMTARMRGWHTQCFTEFTTHHHRPMGTGAGNSRLSASYRLGQRAYRLGWHPAWQVFRSVYQMTRQPYFVGGAALLAGYGAAMFHREERPISQELIDFQRRDQMARMRKFFKLG